MEKKDTPPFITRLKKVLKFVLLDHTDDELPEHGFGSRMTNLNYVIWGRKSHDYKDTFLSLGLFAAVILLAYCASFLWTTDPVAEICSQWRQSSSTCGKLVYPVPQTHSSMGFCAPSGEVFTDLRIVDYGGAASTAEFVRCGVEISTRISAFVSISDRVRGVQFLSHVDSKCLQILLMSSLESFIPPDCVLAKTQHFVDA